MVGRSRGNLRSRIQTHSLCFAAYPAKKLRAPHGKSTAIQEINICHGLQTILIKSNVFRVILTVDRVSCKCRAGRVCWACSGSLMPTRPISSFLPPRVWSVASSLVAQRSLLVHSWYENGKHIGKLATEEWWLICKFVICEKWKHFYG